MTPLKLILLCLVLFVATHILEKACAKAGEKKWASNLKAFGGFIALVFLGAAIWSIFYYL